MNRGYSLIEVSITLALVSCVTALATPTFSTWRERHLISRETRRLQRALERAYTIAVLREIPIIVSFDQATVLARTTDDLALFSYTPHHEVAVQLKSKERRELLFYPSHAATPATILVAGVHERCEVVLSLRGRTRRECP